MKVITTCLALVLIAVANSANAAQQENEFIQSYAYSYASTWVNARSHPDVELQQKVGPPRHYVSAYKLLITELFGFQFQCATSSVWAKEYDEEEHPDECQAYLQTGAMRLSGPEDGFTPYAQATWQGTIVVRSVSRYYFEYSRFYHHQLRHGTDMTHRIVFTFTDVVTGERDTVARNFDQEYHGEPGYSQLTPGVKTINVTIESYFPGDPYYYGFENIQGGLYIRIRRAD